MWLESAQRMTSHTAPRLTPWQAKEVIGPDAIGPCLEILRTTRRGDHVDTDVVAMVVPHVGSAALLDPGNHVGARRIARFAVLMA